MWKGVEKSVVIADELLKLLLILLNGAKSLHRLEHWGWKVPNTNVLLIIKLIESKQFFNAVKKSGKWTEDVQKRVEN